MITTRIDLAHLDESQTVLLKELLLQYSEQYIEFLKKDKPYLLQRTNPDTLRTELIDITLSHDIIIRIRTRSNNNKIHRFEIIDHHNKIGEGGYSQVFDVMATLAINNDVLEISKEKERVVKIVQCAKDELSEIRNEVYISMRAETLHIKHPVIIKNDDGTYNCYLVMKKLHGTDLEAVMQQMFQSLVTLSGYQRLGIGIKILEELIKLHEKGIVHRDLKSNNILLDLNNGKLTLFDFGLSKFDSDNDKGEFQGTLGFIPFEVYAGEGTTFKSDVYAAAISIALLFYADDPEQSEDDFIEYQFDNLFNDPTLDFTEDEKLEIKKLLQDMAAYDVNARLSAKQALTALFNIRDNYINRQIAEMAAKPDTRYVINHGLFFDRHKLPVNEARRVQNRSSCKF